MVGQTVDAARRKNVFLDIFSEVEKVELEHEMAFSATIFWAGSCWEGKWKTCIRPRLAVTETGRR